MLITIRCDQARKGDMFQSSHGYKLLITEVVDTAMSRADDRRVEIKGHLHADPTKPIYNERYPANSRIEVERKTRRYAWLVISPHSDLNDEGVYVGIQTKVEYDTPDDLSAHVARILQTWDCGLEGPVDFSQRHNHRVGLINEGGYETGLEFAVIPCSASGTNIDVEPNEPRGE
jgi:hypothetical protein